MIAIAKIEKQATNERRCNKKNKVWCLEAFTVNNGWARLVVLLLGDPHLLEGGQRGQDGATDPDGVLALRGSNDLNLHGAGCEGSDLLLHAVSNTREHGGATRHNGVGVQVFTDVHVALHDGVVRRLMNTCKTVTGKACTECDTKLLVCLS